MSHLLESDIDHIEDLKNNGKLDEALRYVNGVLTKDPSNEEALLQVADIQYRKGELDKAAKAVDYLNTKRNNEDPMGLYIKGVLEMEKNHRKEAKRFLRDALTITNFDNHEILRCYGLCEYRYGNREKGIGYIENAFESNNRDAEVIYNLIELYLLEHRYRKAANLIGFYHENHTELETFDKDLNYYDAKIGLFEKYVRSYDEKKGRVKTNTVSSARHHAG